MAVLKTWEDNDGTQLRVHSNTQRCMITIGYFDDEESASREQIILDLSDLSELIIELQFIKKQMENNE